MSTESIEKLRRHCLQFAVGGALALLMWTFKLHERPKVSVDTVCLNHSPRSHNSSILKFLKQQSASIWKLDLVSIGQEAKQD